ncbi:hypothetical protein CHU98_g7062 [Xylaria longipes]|nr:hypothetical protein CHU98_g7062 [Xylaria longipes]
MKILDRVPKRVAVEGLRVIRQNLLYYPPVTTDSASTRARQGLRARFRTRQRTSQKLTLALKFWCSGLGPNRQSRAQRLGQMLESRLQLPLRNFRNGTSPTGVKTRGKSCENGSQQLQVEYAPNIAPPRAADAHSQNQAATSTQLGPLGTPCNLPRSPEKGRNGLMLSVLDVLDLEQSSASQVHHPHIPTYLPTLTIPLGSVCSCFVSAVWVNGAPHGFSLGLINDLLPSTYLGTYTLVDSGRFPGHRELDFGMTSPASADLAHLFNPGDQYWFTKHQALYAASIVIQRSVPILSTCRLPRRGRGSLPGCRTRGGLETEGRTSPARSSL